MCHADVSTLGVSGRALTLGTKGLFLYTINSERTAERWLVESGETKGPGRTDLSVELVAVSYWDSGGNRCQQSRLSLSGEEA
jgi:hypothetical protein